MNYIMLIMVMCKMIKCWLLQFVFWYINFGVVDQEWFKFYDLMVVNCVFLGVFQCLFVMEIVVSMFVGICILSFNSIGFECDYQLFMKILENI